MAAFELDGGTSEMTGISAIPFSTSASCAAVVLFSVSKCLLIYTLRVKIYLWSLGAELSTRRSREMSQELGS